MALKLTRVSLFGTVGGDVSGQATSETNGAGAARQDSARLSPLTEAAAESRRKKPWEQLLLLMRMWLMITLSFRPLTASSCTSSLVLPSSRGDSSFG